MAGSKIVRRLFSVVFFVSFAVPSAFAASPSLGGIAPRGGQRGAEVVMFFNGARLGDVQEVMLYSPGFSVGKLEVVNDNQIKATVKLAPDCRLGEHALRMRTASGISELRTFWVGALPVVEEKEPNSDFATSQKVPMNVTVHGIIQSEDVDYFLVEAKKGQRVTAEVEGMRLANTLFDPYVAILDMKRFELATSDDAPLLGQDAVASIVAPADGSYIIQVRESAYGGNGGCAYRLHIGSFPRPQAANQTETVLPMNAAGNAQVRKWKTAVLAVATVGNGPVWVSSQLATLEIAPPFVTFAMERAASEQGKNVEMFCKIQHNTPFVGGAKVRLVGLPPKVTAPEVEITKDTKEIVFKLTVDKTTPAGQHRNIFCQVVVTQRA